MLYLARFPNYTLVITATAKLYNQSVLARAAPHFTIKDFKGLRLLSYMQMCWQWCANGCNNSQQCCGDLQYLVGRIQPIRICKLEFDSHLGACAAPTMLEELCKRIQHCCATLLRSRKKRNVVGSNVRRVGFKLCAATTPTTCNSMCKRTQIITSNNVCKGL